MKDHEEFCQEGKKEKHFFDKESYDSSKGIIAYLKEYQKCPKTTFTLDATPSYIEWDGDGTERSIPQRLIESYKSENLKRKKFILIIREPVARHYSEYQMRIRVCLDHGDLTGKGSLNTDDDQDAHQDDRGYLSCDRVSFNYEPGINAKKLHIMTFQEWLKAKDGFGEMARGDYLKHINGWLKAVSRDQFFILNFQSLITDTGNVMNRLGKFLGLARPWSIDTVLPEQHKKKPVTTLDCKSFDYLTEYYNKNNKGLIAFINNGAKHPEEPTFPSFSSNRSVCKDVASSISPLYAMDLLESEAGQLGSKSEIAQAAKAAVDGKSASNTIIANSIWDGGRKENQR